MSSNELERAARAIAGADAILIGAGAGMGVDSGLPDFRGPEGFWRAYPPLAKLGMRFEEMSNPRWFDRDPAQAWGFFGHRLNLYRDKEPHEGFAILRRWAEGRPGGYFVFTSNVDGHFQRADFDEERIVECHGSIHFLQCSRPCADDLWTAEDLRVDVDEETIRALPPLPKCPLCRVPARPNILMFGDFQWIPTRSADQEKRYVAWRRKVGKQGLVVIELGAGLAVPTVRRECQGRGGTLIRINPREPEVPPGGIGLAMNALAALREIDAILQAGGEG